MNRFHSLSQFKFDVWLIEQLRNAPFPGLTLDELRHRWQDVPGRKANLFRDCFGVWHDYESYPVRDITISCTEEVANYLRTLPLRHSQREDAFREGEEARVIFHYHPSPSPDFIGELLKWGDGIRLKEEK